MHNIRRRQSSLFPPNNLISQRFFLIFSFTVTNGKGGERNVGGLNFLIRYGAAAGSNIVILPCM